MSDVRYWLWIQKALGTSACFKEIIEDFASVEKLYNADIFELKMSRALTLKKIEKLQSVKLEEVNGIVEECKRNNWLIIGFDDERYPKRLRNIDNPPAVLFVQGELPDLDSFVTIGIVGTRKASTYALKVAKVMSKGISLCNAITVSGGALGIDSAAHIGAIEAKRPTVAVLGNGFGASYLKSNEQLRQNIVASGGALITEYPPYTKATKYTFPERNRIISGLSLGVFVVEASTGSGSIITANFAKKYDRDIYAVPASVFDYRFSGTNELIDSGATVATSPIKLIDKYKDSYPTLDINKMPTLRELAGWKDKKEERVSSQFTFDNITKDRAKRTEISEKALELRGNEKTVYNVLGEDFMSAEEISQAAKLDVSKTFSALTLLEIKGIAESAQGKRYRLK